MKVNLMFLGELEESLQAVGKASIQERRKGFMEKTQV